MAMALFNDIHESRINDLHKMGHYYIDFKEAEKKVFEDQTEKLHPFVRKDIRSLREKYNQQLSPESVVARDADILECLIQAKEYCERGYLQTKKFFQKAPDHLKTKSARDCWRKIKNWDSSRWWEEVVKFER